MPGYNIDFEVDGSNFEGAKAAAVPRNAGNFAAGDTSGGSGGNLTETFGSGVTGR